MKQFRTLLFVVANLVAATTGNAQDNKTAHMKTIIESQNYIFKAITVYPQGGRSRHLDYGYDLIVTKEKVISHLPYIGKSSSSHYGSGDEGIKFESSKFDYKLETTSKEWEITIKPKDAFGITKLVLTVFDNGSAKLRVTSTNRQGISFDGNIVGGEQKGF